MLYEGTVVAAGQTSAVVAATGAGTEVGRSARATTPARSRSAVSRQGWRTLVKATIPVALGSAGALVAVGLLRGRPLQPDAGHGGEPGRRGRAGGPAGGGDGGAARVRPPDVGAQRPGPQPADDRDARAGRHPAAGQDRHPHRRPDLPAYGVRRNRRGTAGQPHRRRPGDPRRGPAGQPRTGERTGAAAHDRPRGRRGRGGGRRRDHQRPSGSGLWSTTCRSSPAAATTRRSGEPRPARSSSSRERPRSCCHGACSGVGVEASNRWARRPGTRSRPRSSGSRTGAFGSLPWPSGRPRVGRT